MAYKMWTGGTGDWSVGSNWTGGAAPQSGDISIIQDGVSVATNVGVVGQLVWLNHTSATSAYEPANLDLIGSSIGPTSVVLMNGNAGQTQMRLHNSALEGQIFAGSGLNEISVDPGTSAVNTGWIGVAMGGVDYGQDWLSLNVGAGNFANVGAIQAGVNGYFQLNFGFQGVPQFVGNWGIIEADPGGTVRLDTTQHPTGLADGTLVNFGQIKVEGGYLTTGANLLQSDTGTVSIKGGGTALITGKTDGGTIQIEKGMLDLGDRAQFARKFDFNSEVEFTGSDGSIEVGTPYITLAFDEATNTLDLLRPWKDGTTSAGSIHLGDNRHYALSDFTVSRGTDTDTVMYHQPGATV